MQHEITKARQLLDRQGDLREPGWARSLLSEYRCRDVKANVLRIKEWDYYFVSDGHIGLALTVSDNSYMGMDSISFLNFDEGWEITQSPMRLLPLGRTALPERSDSGITQIRGRDYAISFSHERGGRRLRFHMNWFRGLQPIKGSLLLTEEPPESMVIATPFDKPGHFYYNQKINCMRCSGWIDLGNTRFTLTPDRFFGVLDWGRGVWTYHNTWYWGSASGELDGVPFGFNIGYGFGNTRAASENVLFYDGKLHKLGRVAIRISKRDGAYDFLSPWKIISNDNRFTMDFAPILDRSACAGFRMLGSNQHQVFGRFTGHVTLDDGKELPVRDFFGFVERVENRW